MNWLRNECSCGSSNPGSYAFGTRDNNFKTTIDKCSIMRCLGCGSLYPEKFPTIESISDAYKNYYTCPKKRRGLRRMLRKLTDLTRWGYLIRETPKHARSILDYGCGSGEFLSILAKNGIGEKLYGTDFFKPKSDEPVSLKFEWLSLEQFEETERLYDWITMSHVIEHISSVMPVLSRLAKALKNNGSLWISTPNADSLLIKHFKGLARDIDFPRHRQIFSRNALENTMTKHGFRVEFLASPRINTLLNFNSCARNVWSCEDMTNLSKIRLILKAGIHTLHHMLLPKKLRNLEAPELVALCTAKINS